MAQLVDMLSHGPKRSRVQFPVRTCAWVAGLVPGRGMYRRHLVDVSLALMSVSLSLSLSSPLSPPSFLFGINAYILQRRFKKMFICKKIIKIKTYIKTPKTAKGLALADDKSIPKPAKHFISGKGFIVLKVLRR